MDKEEHSMYNNFNYDDFATALAGSESDNNYSLNTGNGVYGRYQFKASTIKQVEDYLNLPNQSIEYFLNSPSYQDTIYKGYIQIIDNKIISEGLTGYIGLPITGKGNGITSNINYYGLIAGGWLGGPGGLENLLKGTNDASDHTNPKTGGTYVSDYVAKFSGLNIQDKKKSTPPIGNSGNINDNLEKQISKIVSLLAEISNILKTLNKNSG